MCISRLLVAWRHTAAQLRRFLVLRHPGCTHNLVGGLKVNVVIVSLHILLRLTLPSSRLIVFALANFLAVTHPVVSISTTTSVTV